MAEVPVSRAQCSMSSACALCSTLQLTGAAHDALQTRDRAKLPRWAGRSLGRVPNQRRTASRTRPLLDDAPIMYALALRRIRDTQPP